MRGYFWPKMAQNGFLPKNRALSLFSIPDRFQKKLMNGFRENCVTDERTNGRTDGTEFIGPCRRAAGGPIKKKYKEYSPLNPQKSPSANSCRRRGFSLRQKTAAVGIFQSQINYVWIPSKLISRRSSLGSGGRCRIGEEVITLLGRSLPV